MKEITLLCLFDYKANTGFATVSRNLIAELKKIFRGRIKFHICAINYFDDPYDEDENVLVFSAIKSAPKKDDFGRFGFLKILKESDEYDGIVIIQDLGVIVPIIELLEFIRKDKKEKNQKNFKSLFYFPVDCKVVPALVKGLEFFDTLITYTEYGREEVLKVRPELKGKLKVIPHGINTKHFYPKDKKEVEPFRKEYFGESNAQKFIITNVNRNQPRKDIPTTIFAFQEAKKNWVDPKRPPFLYLHMNPNDPMGWDLRAIFMQTDLVEDEDYKLTPKAFENHGADTEMLNNIYNASDLYVSTTLGEGWGLTVNDSMATMLPVICPYNTSLIEIGGYKSERVWHLMTQIPYCNTIDNVIREQSDYVEVADKMLDLFIIEEDEKKYKKLNSSYNWITRLTWDNIAKQWAEYMKETFF